MNRPLDPGGRQKLYQGEIFLLPASRTSRLLATQALGLLKNQLKTAYPQSLHELWSPTQLHQRFSQIRRLLPQDPGLRQLYAQLLQELGLELQQTAVDQPRLRAVIPGAEKLAAAAPMYYAHRDTWYANPPNQINLWIPLGNYRSQQTFVLWPEVFEQAVSNDSDSFDYHRWQQQTGFQNAAAGAEGIYPRALEQPASEAFSFGCQLGQLLLFSAAQLHQTLPNPGPDIRFSLDLRIVSLQDQQQAQDPDNASQGSTLAEYAYLADKP